MPLPSAVVVPSEDAPSNTSTVLLASAVPVNVGVVSSVMLSVLESPESLPASRSGVDGAAGAVVSMVIFKVPELMLVLPAASVAFAVIA